MNVCSAKQPDNRRHHTKEGSRGPVPHLTELYRAPWKNLKSPKRIGPKVVFQRRGAGYGDMISIASCVQGWRERFPDAELHIETICNFGDVLQHHPDLDYIHSCAASVPTDAMVFDLKSPSWAFQMGTPQPNADRATLFCKLVGIENPTIPRVYLTPAEIEDGKEWAESKIKGLIKGENKASFLVMVWNTRSAYKDYPHMEKLHHFLRSAYPIIALDPTGRAPKPNTGELSIRQAMAVMAHATLVIGGDTGPLHMVGGLSQTIGRKIPYFGLYGSQNPMVRQMPYCLPGGWLSGSCPYGRQPCVEQCCKPMNQHQPCMEFAPEIAEKRILETLEMLPA